MSTITNDSTARAAALLQPLVEIDWTNVDEIREKSEPVMRRLAEEKALLRELVVDLLRDPERLKMCEQDYYLSKYVLYNDPRGRMRLRLHVMREGPVEVPHGHRNSFAVLILRGGYEHTFFTPIDDGETLIGPDELRPAVRRWEGEGVHYAIDHSIIHSTQNKGEPCITLMARGPSLRPKAINLDMTERRSWWHRGAADLSEDEAALVERLDDEKHIGELVSFLEERGVI